MSIFYTYFRGFLGKKVYRPALKKIYFSNIKINFKEAVRNDFIIILEAEII